MKAIRDPLFNSEFPEDYDWQTLVSPTLGALAVSIAQRVREECKLPPQERYRISGLREALIIIASRSSIF